MTLTSGINIGSWKKL